MIDPKEIYSGKEEGFDLRFSRQGMFGKAIYFHNNAKYSDKYSFPYLQNDNNKMIEAKIFLLARVLIGDSIKQDYSEESKAFVMPPLKDEKEKIRYDSVYDDEGKVMIYNNLRAYPQYWILYK